MVHTTHTSVVILIGERAYKVRRCVRLPFIDLSTVEARRRMCHLEVHLNRRFSPDDYLGVAEVNWPWSQGQDAEPVVVMRRLPWERRLTALLDAAPQEARECVVAVAGQVARAHAAQPPLSSYSLAETMAALWREGTSQLRPFCPGVLDGDELTVVAELAQAYLAGRTALLDRREAAGLVKDGHGDLLADDIFWVDGSAHILDCLEFDARLRHGDVLLDVAFLAMDLRCRGADDLVGLLLAEYARHSTESHPASLEHHYIAYRAFVRAKVECLRVAEGEPDAAARARDYLRLCHRELLAGRVHLVLIGGLPGSGKSTVARQVAAGADEPGSSQASVGPRSRRSWLVISSDIVRKELAARAGLPPGADLYDSEHTAATYAELTRRAGAALADGMSVILDASWTSAPLRDQARQVAAAHGAALNEFVCRVPDDLAATRILGRRNAFASDATPAVRHLLAERADPWPQAVPVSTAGPPQDAADAIFRALGRDPS